MAALGSKPLQNRFQGEPEPLNADRERFRVESGVVGSAAPPTRMV
jgi:hypothetical protein